MRQFDTGATRDLDDDKLDFEGFLSPTAMMAFASYMHEHRKTANGLRASDNWQKGIPMDAYMKSMWRHFFDVWALHREVPGCAETADMVEALCALMFNVQGYLHETLRQSATFKDAPLVAYYTESGEHREIPFPT